MQFLHLVNGLAPAFFVLILMCYTREHTVPRVPILLQPMGKPFDGRHCDLSPVVANHLCRTTIRRLLWACLLREAATRVADHRLKPQRDLNSLSRLYIFRL